MHQVLAGFSVSISELKKNQSALISQSCGSPIAVLNHNKPSAWLVLAETYEAMMDMIADHETRKTWGRASWRQRTGTSGVPG
jgi:antitoxin StbD